MAAEAPHRTLLTNENFKTMGPITQRFVASAIVVLLFFILKEIMKIHDILKNNNNDNE